MRTKIPSLILAAFCFCFSSASGQQSLDALIDQQIASLVATYKTLHAAPELSHHEEKTASFFAKELRALGYTVTERVGKYDRPEWTSYGVVAVLKNGAGPTVLVRTELDALPVEEKTGLPYASKAKAPNDAGQEVSVMHACGHDIHVTTMLGTAKMLAALKDQWSGTLVLIGQPAEETVQGARAMLADGLYTRFPKPDFAIALHDSADFEAGKIGYTPGYALSSSTSVDIKIRGIGGHGARPDAAKDPIVVAAQVILALQTIISRENSPLDPAVITVGSIHGGTKHNILPDNLAPIVNVSSEGTVATYNDPALTGRLVNVFVKALGRDNVINTPQIMASEDFAYYSLEGHQIPSLIFWVGAVDPPKVKQSRETGMPLPTLHSALFSPLPEPTIRTGIKAMT